VNIPARPADQIAGLRVCRLGSREYHDVIVRKQDPRGRDYYWVGGHDVTFAPDGDTDFVLNSQGYITVTPLQVDITDRSRLQEFKSWEGAWTP
jgi:5'-nucleotidase